VIKEYGRLRLYGISRRFSANFDLRAPADTVQLDWLRGAGFRREFRNLMGRILPRLFS
jgi:hypothetical protein